MASASPDAVCVRIADRLADTVGRHRYNIWFERSARLAYRRDESSVEVAVPNEFVANWIADNFREALEQAVLAEVGPDVKLDVQVLPDRFDHTNGNGPDSTAEYGLPTGATPAVRRATARQNTLRHNLDKFIVGPSNELAFNAANQLVDDDRPTCNPLFIHGEVGLGKTHLLQGVCRKMLNAQPDARVLYTTGENFTNAFLTAMRNRTLDSFRRNVRRLDLLAIDDVHFLAGKKKTQQEFLHSFDELDLADARVVLASDNHPKLIKRLSAALVSRCVRGLVVEIHPPDRATRIAIVKALAERRGIPLMQTVAAVLARRCRGSVRDIEGTIARLHALATLTDGPGAGLDVSQSSTDLNEGTDAPRTTTPVRKPIGHALLNRLFEDDAARPKKPVSFERILDVVAEQVQVSRSQIYSGVRARHIVLARSLVIYLARKLTTMSYPEITVAINRTSHSTVIAADRRIAQQMSDDAKKKPPLPAPLETTPLSELVDRLRDEILYG